MSAPHDATAVPFISLRAQYPELRDEIRTAIDGVLESQQFVLGPHGEALENSLAAYCDSKYAVALANGTHARAALMHIPITSYSRAW